MDDTTLIAEIESWIGTRWIHGQCLKGIGVDCVRFVCAIGKFAGWVDKKYTVPVYNKDWALHNTATMLEDEVCKFCDKTIGPYQVGDIMLFIYARSASHAGIYIGGNKMVHSYQGGGVVKSDLKHYMKYLHSVWRPRGINE